MALYLDKGAADAEVGVINNQITALADAASAIDAAMGRLAEAWQGASATKAQDTYAADYKDMLINKIPETVGELKSFIDGCVAEITSTDQQLAGK